jgi:Leucine-rich repeat (LRR) protein
VAFLFITRINATPSKCTALSTVDLVLVYNQPGELPRDFMKLHLEITTLEATNLNFTNLSMVFTVQQCYLKHLNLSHNRLIELNNYEFYGIDNIETLSLANNLLKTIQRLAFQNLDKVQRIDLSHNRLQELVSGVFDSLKSSLEIKMNSNQLKVANLKLYILTENLEKLDLSRNHIDEILYDDKNETSELNFSNHNLAYLNLGHNRLELINFTKMPNFRHLAEVNLQGNKLKAIVYKGLVEHLPNLKKINISGHQLDNTTVFAINQYFNLNGINAAPFEMDNISWFMLGIIVLVDMGWTVVSVLWR